MRLVILIKSGFWILYEEKCQHVEDLHNSARQYFPNSQYRILQNHAWVKIDPFKVQGMKGPLIQFRFNIETTIACQDLVQYQRISTII